MAILEVGADRQIIAQGIYKAKIVLAEQTNTYKMPDGSEVTYRDIVWRITDGNYKDTEIVDGCVDKLSPLSKLGELAETVTGKPLTVKQKFDTDSLLNIPCNIVVKVEKVTNKKTGGTFDKNIIESVMRI